MVPIVEPEVLMDGEHSAKECYEKTSEVIKNVLKNLFYIKDLKELYLNLI